MSEGPIEQPAPAEDASTRAAQRRPRAVQEATAEDWLGSNRDPDVLLSVPDLGVDRITLSVQDLRAHVDLHAKVLELLELRVGADVTLGSVELEIENVHAQAMLKVNLDKVAQIVDRVMATIDNNPEILTSLLAPIGRGVEELGRGAGDGVRGIGQGARSSPPAIDTVYEARYDEAGRPRSISSSAGAVETVLRDGQWWNRAEGTEAWTGPYDTEEEALRGLEE